MGFIRTLFKIGTVFAIIIGIGCIILGVLGLAGVGGITFTISGEEVTPEEGGKIFTAIGIVILLVGIVGYHYLFRKKR